MAKGYFEPIDISKRQRQSDAVLTLDAKNSWRRSDIGLRLRKWVHYFLIYSDIMRVYKHLNPGSTNAHPVRSTRTAITASSDIRDWLSQMGQRASRDGAVTVTFIVDTDGVLWIADRHSEHTACAAGRGVLSAGEITFDLTGPDIVVCDVTNQSLGYCPEPESWPAVASALKRAGIGHPGCFTTEFVFRQCFECGAKNIVKDGWFECGVCGGALEPTWNFIKGCA